MVDPLLSKPLVNKTAKIELSTGKLIMDKDNPQTSANAFIYKTPRPQNTQTSLSLALLDTYTHTVCTTAFSEMNVTVQKFRLDLKPFLTFQMDSQP